MSLAPCSPGSDDTLQRVTHLDRILVLPESQNGPAEGVQMLVGSSIPLDVPTKFLGPPLSIRLRNAQMLRAGVPEATIDEDRDLGRTEHHVRTSPAHSGQRSVHAITESTSMSLLAEQHLRRGIAAWSAAHALRHLGTRSRRPVVVGDRCSSGGGRREATSECQTLALGFVA